VPKSIRLVFGQSLVAVYLQGLVFILKSGMVRAASGLPAEHTEEHLKLKEESIRTYARMWDMFRVLIARRAFWISGYWSAQWGRQTCSRKLGSFLEC